MCGCSSAEWTARATASSTDLLNSKTMSSWSPCTLAPVSQDISLHVIQTTGVWGLGDWQTDFLKLELLPEPPISLVRPCCLLGIKLLQSLEDLGVCHLEGVLTKLSGFLYRSWFRAPQGELNMLSS